MNEPDVLSDKEILKAQTYKGSIPDLRRWCPYRSVAQAQRDADYKHEQNTIREIFEEIEELGKHRRRTSKHVVNYITINHKNWNALKEKMNG